MSAVPMFVDPERGAGLRHAVLQWHSLQPADREWLLAQLDVPARQQVQALLREIDELGIAPRRTRGKPMSNGAGGLPSRPDPATLARVLAGEPPLLIAGLLTVCTGPWRDALLSGLDAAQAAAVRTASAGLAPMPVMLREALEQALLRRYARALVEGAVQMPDARVRESMFWRALIGRVFAGKQERP
jgi:hypothetical protein